MKKLFWPFAAVVVCNLALAQPTSNPVFLNDMGFSAGGWKNNETVRIAGDVNGDGKADLIGYSGAAVRVAFSNGTSFSPVQVVNQDFTGWSYRKHVRTSGDVNGDGKADLIAFGDAGVFVAYSTGSGFGPLSLLFNDMGNVAGGWTADATVRTTGDVNGDGKADLIGYSGGAVRVAFSTGTGFLPVQILNQDFAIWSFANHVRTAADVNGDGKADLVGFGDEGTYVAFSKGNGFEPLTLVFNDLGTTSGWNNRTMVRIMADVNGDNKSDIVGFNGDQVIVCYSTGRSFQPLQVISYDFSGRSGYTFDRYVVTAADVNGDKSADLIGFGDQGVIVQLSPAPVVVQVPLEATIYQHGDYKGSSKNLPVGRYDIGALGIGNDQLSSVRVPKGLKVTLYEHGNFQGRSMVLTQDDNVQGILANRFNDVTSSIVVEADQPPVPPLEVTIYQHGDYKGTSKNLPVGRYDISALGIGNDQLSSVRVPNGLKVTLYEHANFKGRNMVLTQDDNVQGILANRFNDITSSIVVEASDVPVVVPVVAVPVVVETTTPVVTVPAGNCEMSEQQYNNALRAVEGQAFRDAKMQMAKNAIKNKCLSIAQIRGIAKLFSFEDQTLDFVKYAYDFTDNKSEYYTLGDVFSFNSNVENFNAFLSEK